jgi:hypothetical protein
MPVIAPVSFDDFCAQAGTCDLVLWGGSSKNSTGVEVISNSIYSHTTMVIVEPGTRAPYLLQSVPESFEPDPLVGNKVHSGVQAGALRKSMLDLIAYKDHPTWRPYTGANQSDPVFIQSVWDIATSLDGIPFPEVPWGMAYRLFEGRVEGIEKTDKLFCSGLAGLMYKRLGIIDQAIPCNAYFPKDFSSMYPGFLNVISGSFGLDTVIDVSGVQSES